MIISGSAQTIQARKPFPEADKTNEYCCHSLMNDVSFTIFRIGKKSN